MTITKGPFKTGMRPDPLLHTFDDWTGAPIPLEDYTPTARMIAPRATESVALTCTFQDAEEGIVRIEWPSEPFEISGTYYLDVFVASAGPIYASDRIRFYVHKAVPTPV